MRLAFIAIMIRPRCSPSLFIARTVSVAEFVHSLGQERTLAAEDFMSALPPKADVKREKADIGFGMSVSPPKADVI